MKKKEGGNMNLPRLEMSSTYAHIGMNSKRPPMSIRQPNADLQISQSHVNLNIKRSNGTLTIDQSEAFASVDSKPPLRRANEFFAKTKSVVAKYISKTARQGDQIMRIEKNSGNAFAQIAAENSKLFEHETKYNLAPKPLSVKMNYQLGELSVTVNPDRVDIKVQKRDPQITIPKWQADVYVRQKNNLTIRAVGLNVNRGL